MDVDLGYLPYGEKHEDTKFSNNLLKSFYPLVRSFIPSKHLFRKRFMEEKCRQWQIYKKKKAFEKSDNMASIGNRLEEGYVPKTNDGNVLAGVSVKLASLLEKIKTLIAEIRSHDQSLFEANGRCLKQKWQ